MLVWIFFGGSITSISTSKFAITQKWPSIRNQRVKQYLQVLIVIVEHGLLIRPGLGHGQDIGVVPHPAQVLDVVEEASLFAALKFPITADLAGSGVVVQVVHVQLLLEVCQVDAQDVP